MIALGARSPERVVLVVEDDELVRHFMVRSLTEEGGFRVVAAASGAEALRLLTGLEPAAVGAVVTDFVMPGMDGVQLAAGVAERWPTIPLLMVSARPPEQWHGPFLAKPFSPPALVEAVAQLPSIAAG